MLEKCLLTVLELIWNQRLGHKKTKLNICHHMLTSSLQLQNRSFHVVERTRTSTGCQKMKNARAKRAKILFFILKYANLWSFCCRCRRGCLSSLITFPNGMYNTGLQLHWVLYLSIILEMNLSPTIRVQYPLHRQVHLFWLWTILWACTCLRKSI